mgnify:CR=1 FL=1
MVIRAHARLTGEEDPRPHAAEIDPAYMALVFQIEEAAGG